LLMDDFDNPSDNLKAEYKILKADEPVVVYIPPGYANGLKALESNSEIAVFSDLDVNESVKEKRRYPSEWWLDWNQDFMKEERR
jgi:dTDP-4-dehydrorhamnose 3,5-epimerase-like enzyme